MASAPLERVCEVQCRVAQSSLKTMPFAEIHSCMTCRTAHCARHAMDTASLKTAGSGQPRQDMSRSREMFQCHWSRRHAVPPSTRFDVSIPQGRHRGRRPTGLQKERRQCRHEAQHRRRTCFRTVSARIFSPSKSPDLTVADAFTSMPAIKPSLRSRTMSTSRFMWSRKWKRLSHKSDAVISFRISEYTKLSSSAPNRSRLFRHAFNAESSRCCQQPGIEKLQLWGLDDPLERI